MAFKVSIVIPIYNVAAYIGDCLRSVFEQTYPQIEVVLVDDVTPDDSMEQAVPWIQKLQEKYEVKTITHAVNRGLSAARNTGIKASTGDWVYFLDSDDEITPDCIALMVAEVEKHPDVDFVIGNVKFVGSTWDFPLKCKAYVTGNEKILYDYTTYKWYMMAWNRLYKKTYILKHNLYFKEGLLHEDELYSFQVATTAQAMAAVYEETYIYKVRSVGSITAQRKLKNFEDISYTIREKCAYTLKQYRSGVFVIPYTYGLECIYGYTISLLENRVLKKKDKIRLLSALQKAYSPLDVYMKGHLAWKQELLRWVYKLPANWVLMLVRWRLKMLSAN